LMGKHEDTTRKK